MEATRKSNHSGKSSQSDVAASLAPVVERVAAGAHEAVDKAAGAAAAAAKMVEKKGEVLKAVQERYIEGCRERVRDNPLAALGVALAAGIAVSFLLIRR
jgi:ElaB/YqjD/DUF883 family membrane-anchored ribosome-binding protein